MQKQIGPRTALYLGSLARIPLIDDGRHLESTLRRIERNTAALLALDFGEAEPAPCFIPRQNDVS